MKTQFNVSIELSTITDVRAKAGKVGVPLNELVDLYMRFGLSKLSDKALDEWALSVAAGERAKTTSTLRADQRRVLEALKPTRTEEGLCRMSLGEIAVATGLRFAVAHQALRDLQARRLVHGFESAELDRWGRPLESFWCLGEPSGEVWACMPAVYAALREARTFLSKLVVDPAEMAVLERDAGRMFELTRAAVAFRCARQGEVQPLGSVTPQVRPILESAFDGLN